MHSNFKMKPRLAKQLGLWVLEHFRSWVPDIRGFDAIDLSTVRWLLFSIYCVAGCIDDTDTNFPLFEFADLSVGQTVHFKVIKNVTSCVKFYWAVAALLVGSESQGS